MQGANRLDQLRDIHLPAEISAWPPAYGWWLLAALIIILIAGVIFALLRHRSANRYRHHASAELETLTVSDLSDQAYVAQLSVLLKRAAISAFGEACSTLHGEAWLKFLVQHCPCCEPKQLHIICIGQYTSGAAINRQTLFNQARLWLQRHK